MLHSLGQPFCLPLLRTFILTHHQLFLQGEGWVEVLFISVLLSLPWTVGKTCLQLPEEKGQVSPVSQESVPFQMLISVA